MAAHRGHGEGSVYYDKAKKRYYASITLPDGGRKKSQGFKAKRDAQRELADMVHQLQASTLATGPRQTVEQYMESWLGTHKTNLAPSTYVKYERDIRNHILPTLGRLALGRITPQDLVQLYTAKLDKGLSPASVGHLHRILHKALKDAVNLDLLGRNVADRVSPPRRLRPNLRWLSAEEALQLLKAARGDRFEALYTLALLTGLREGELLGLAWECVDLDAATLRVERTLAYIPQLGLVFGAPKSDSSRRVLPLAPMAVAALKAHRERQDTERDLQGSRWQESGLVFPNTLGKPQDPTNFVVQRFRPLLKNAELPQIRFHDLRHSTGSLLTALGVHHRVIQEILGHSSYVVTMSTYSHVAQTSQVEALNSLAQRLGG